MRARGSVPMYLVGAAHPHKVDAQRCLERAIVDGERLVTDAEVLQEILQRYVAIGRRDAIQPALESLLGAVDEVFPVDLATVLRARVILLALPRLSARDAVHAAVMEARKVSRIFTFDAGFDAYPGLERISS